MIKQRHRTVRSVFAIMLAILLAGVISPVKNNVFAAGNITVKLANIEGVGDDFPGLTFNLYKVGSYEGSGFTLDEYYAGAKVTLPSEDDQEAWLNAASKLANYIDHPAEGQTTPEPVKIFSDVKPGGSMSYDSPGNYLYLLVGETVTYDNANYTAVPMFVGTLNGDSTYLIDADIKIVISPIVFEHSVIKTWDDEENKDGVRPEWIEVGIYYGSQLIDRIVLGGPEGIWTYKWKSEETGDTYVYIGTKNGEEVRIEFKPGPNDNAWGVREFTNANEISDAGAQAEADKLIYYEPEYSKSSSETLELFMINNPYDAPPEEPDEPDEPPHNIDTGDTNNIALWCSVAGIACLLLIVFAVARKKKKEDE